MCRAEVCPFGNKKGCKVTSTCLQKDVIEQYKEALAPAKTPLSAPTSLPTSVTGGSTKPVAWGPISFCRKNSIYLGSVELHHPIVLYGTQGQVLDYD